MSLKNLIRTLFIFLHISTLPADAQLAKYALPRQVQSELLELQTVIEDVVGSSVIWLETHELCREGLYGAYIPSKDTLFMCIANHQGDWEELKGTTRHEGWHAVQFKCNNYRAALRDEQIRAHLKPRDKRTLHGYHPKQHRAEAEARVVEQIPTPNWIKGVNIYCGR